jgi:hypothetical protein
MMSTGLGLSFVALILAQACPPHSTLKKGTCGVFNCIDRSKGKIVGDLPCRIGTRSHQPVGESTARVFC